MTHVVSKQGKAGKQGKLPATLVFWVDLLSAIMLDLLLARFAQ
jgi:hypothetical protein